jgi:hypothetical protein
MRTKIQNFYMRATDSLMEKLRRLEEITGMHRAIWFTYLFGFVSLLIIAMSITITVMLLLPGNNTPAEYTETTKDVYEANADVQGVFHVTKPIELPRATEAQVKAIYAGRYDNVKSSDYDMLGLPKDRMWLTGKEWRGEHLKDISQRARFKMWKALHMKEFIDYMHHLAEEEVKEYPDIPKSLIMAQAILESNFGLSRVAVESNNIYGHKCHGCKKKSEYIVAHDDSPTDRFRIKKTKWASVRSHSKLLMGLYRKRITGKPTLDKWLNALCGCDTPEGSRKFRKKAKKNKTDGRVYATSCFKGEGYANKLRKIIKCYELDKY